MEVIRISELPEKSSADVADIVPIVDVSGGGYATKRTTVAGLIFQAIESWWSGSSAKETVEDLQVALDGKASIDNPTVSLSGLDNAEVNFRAGGYVLYEESIIDGGVF